MKRQYPIYRCLSAYALILTLLAAPVVTVRESTAQTTLSKKASKTFSKAYPAATLTVTNTNDSGAGSLRQAIAGAVSGDTINFSGGISGGTITLTSGQLVIDKNLTIQGPGASLLSISGNNASIVFVINYGITVTLDGMTIRSGYADDGAGITNSGTLTVSNSAISGNVGLGGGGIFNASTLTLVGSTVSGNTAVGEFEGSGGGGGIFNAGSTTVTSSTISGNTANTFGGGIFNRGMLTVSDSTVTGNTANAGPSIGGGGGIGNSTDGTMTVTNSTISSNSTSGANGAGGGIFAGTINTTLTNTIVAGNSSGAGNDIYGPISSASHNLMGDAASSGGIQNGVNGNIVGVNPLLGPLQNNGGPTLTHALLPGSPAINAGDNCVLTANGCRDGNPALPTDQRGVPRNGIVDIGSFELAPAAVSVSGRMMTPDGRGLRNAFVKMTPIDSMGNPVGPTRTVTTSSFGFYSFDNVTVGGSYLMTVSSRLYRFLSRQVPVGFDNLTGVDFVGQE